MKRHNVKWQVGLSNGETFFEDKGNFCIVEGEPSPWQRLLLYLAENKASITSLSLITDSGQRWNLPSAGNRPKFKAFEDAETPVDFDCFRKVAFDVVNTEKEIDLATTPHDLFTVAQAEFETYFLQIWVNENNARHAWTLTLNK